MNTARDTHGNQTKMAKLAEAWRQLLAESLQRGFHGSAAIEIQVNDGVVQHIRRKVERMER